MVTEKKVTVTKWLYVAFAFLALQFAIVGIVIHSDVSHPHLLGRVIIAGGTYQISLLLKYIVGVSATGIPIIFILHMIESRDRIRRKAGNERSGPENDLSAWPPAPRIDRQ